MSALLAALAILGIFVAAAMVLPVLFGVVALAWGLVSAAIGMIGSLLSGVAAGLGSLAGGLGQVAILVLGVVAGGALAMSII